MDSENKLFEYVVSDEYEGLRIDKLLSELSPSFSRTYIKKLIDDKKVFCNGKNVKASFCISENDYIKILKDGRYSICYIPSTSTISIFEIANVADAYILNGGEFISLNKDNDNIVHYEIEVTSEFGKTCALTDPSYKMLNVTLDASVDNTCITKHDNNTFTLTKKGTYKLHLNLDDLVLKVDFTAAQEEIPETNKIIKFYDSNGGQSSAFSQEFVVNPENEQEYCLLNYTVQNGWLALVDMSSGSLENIEDVTLSEGSDVATQLSYFFIIQAGTTCNFYYNPTTNSLRIVKVQ